MTGFTGEQAALRRVATLVARAAAPEEVFAAVTEEAGRLLGADYAAMARYDPDGTRTVVAAWSSTGAAFPVGTRARLGGRNVATLVFQTGRAARIDDYAGASGPLAEAVREFGFRAAVGVPVSVEGRLWGVMIVGSRAGPLPAGTEARLAGFTELAATAIANAQARVELRGFAEEQAALRRVATLVAHAAPPAEVFTAVTEEAGRLLHADLRDDEPVRPRRHDNGGRHVEQHRRCLPRRHPAQGSAGGTCTTMVFQTGRPARIDDYADASGPVAEAAREFGLRAACRRAGQRRGAAVGRHGRGIPCGAAAGRHRGAAGRVHRTGRHRDRQRRGPGRPDRLPGADRGHRRCHPPPHRTQPARRRPAAPGLPRPGPARRPGHRTARGRRASAATGRRSRRAGRRTGRTARDRPRPAPGHPGRRRPAPGAEDAGPPIRHPR